MMLRFFFFEKASVALMLVAGVFFKALLWGPIYVSKTYTFCSFYLFCFVPRTLPLWSGWSGSLFFGQCCFFGPRLLEAGLVDGCFLSYHIWSNRDGIKGMITSRITDIQILDYNTRSEARFGFYIECFLHFLF